MLLFLYRHIKNSKRVPIAINPPKFSLIHFPSAVVRFCNERMIGVREDLNVILRRRVTAL